MKVAGVRIGLLGFCLMASGLAEAAVVAYSSGLSGQSRDSFPLAGELTYNGDVEVTRFDPALGILNSVTLDLSAVFNYRTRFENTSNVSSTLDKDILQRLTIGSGLLDTGSQHYSLDQTVSAFDGTVDYAGTSGFDVSASNGVTEQQLFFTGLDMADFVGPGTLFLAVASYADFTATFNGGNASLLNSQEFLTSALVTYNYTPVPLPAAAWLLISGLAGIGIFGRRRGQI